jgi:enamine deaminase RidA (YjgF/YER057c/UK114 family)
MGLPTPPKPQGRYVPALREGELVMTAGMTPRVEGVLQFTGKVGRDICLDDARRAAGIAASNAVAAAAEAVGSADLIQRALRLTVYVNAAEDFTAHPQVADGASDALAELLGERGTVVRSAVGVASLPGGACVEVELTCLA